MLTAGAGALVSAALALEPAPRLVDDGGRPVVTYRVEALFTHGAIVRTKTGTFWLGIAPGDHVLRNRVIAGQNAPPPPAAETPPPPPSPPLAALPNGPGGSFRFSPGRDPAVAVISEGIRGFNARQELAEAIRERVPGARSPRELPWEFVGNELGMLWAWFGAADESKPENRAISAYIAQQHRPQMLLYRLLVKPFLPREPRED